MSRCKSGGRSLTSDCCIRYRVRFLVKILSRLCMLRLFGRDIAPMAQYAADPIGIATATATEYVPATTVNRNWAVAPVTAIPVTLAAAPYRVYLQVMRFVGKLSVLSQRTWRRAFFGIRSRQLTNQRRRAREQTLVQRRLRRRGGSADRPLELIDL